MIMKKICVLFVILIAFFITGCSIKEKNEITLEQKYKEQAKDAEELAKQIEEYKEFKQQQELEKHKQEKINNALIKLGIYDINANLIMYLLNNSRGINNIGTLTEFAKQFVYGKDLSPYVVVSKSDMRYWVVLQKINNGALVFLPNEPKEVTFLLEGNTEEIDNQPLRRNYLLKLDGTFTYNTVFGGSKTVYKLKILTDLTDY